MDEQMDLLCGLLEALPYPVALLNRAGQAAYINARSCPVNLEDVDFEAREDIKTALNGVRQPSKRAMLADGKDGAWGLLEIYPVKSDQTVIGVLVLFHPEFTAGELTADALPGVSAAMDMVRERIQRLSLLNSPVLLLGEEGAGKYDFAHALHRITAGKDKQFIRLEKGASPTHLHRAVLECKDGTLYLNRIDQWSPGILEEVNQLLASKQISDSSGRIAPLLCRVMASAAPELPRNASDGLFPTELFGRLNILPVYIPALRERPEDILPIARRFLEYFSQQFNKDVQNYTREAEETLEAHSWHGNLQELKKAVETAVEVCPGGLVMASHLPLSSIKTDAKSLHKMRDAYTRERINAMLDVYGHTVEGKKLAAKELGVGLSTLYRVLAKK